MSIRPFLRREIDLAVSDAAKEYMTEEGYDEVMGVRPPVG